MKKFILTLIVLGIGIAVWMSRVGDNPADQSTEISTERSVASVAITESVTEINDGTTAPVGDSEADRHDAWTPRLDAIQQDSDYKERPGMLFDLMREASLDEVMELLVVSDNQNTYSLGFRDSMKAAAYERWYHLDPAAALLAMDASSLSSSQKNSRMEVFLEEWAERAPQDVEAFIGQLTGVSSDLTYGALVRGSALNGNLEITEAALARMADPKLRYYALKSAARVLQRDHADQFEGWLNTLPVSEQNAALAESAWILADQEIDRALAGLKQLEERGADELVVTRSRVLVKWTENDPVHAAAWVAEQEISGEEREGLFSTLLRVWMHDDRSAAIAWAENLIEKGEIDDAFMNRVTTRM